jgi:hypothetical protein
MSTLQLVGKFSANVLGGEASGDVGMMDYLTDVIKCTLHTTTWVPNVDTNEAFADATNELGTANGYTANGITIAGKTVVYTAAGGITTFDMDDTTVTWTASGAGLVFRWAVFHDDTVTVGPPIKPLLGYIDCDPGAAGNITIGAGNTFGITTGASGLFTGTVTGA